MKKMLTHIVLNSPTVFTASSCANNTAENVESTDYTPDRTIDFEHHMYTPEVIDFVKARTQYPVWEEGLGIFCGEAAMQPIGIQYPFPLHDPNLSLTILQVITDLDEYRIPYMDYAGLTYGVLSIGPCVEGLAKEDTVRLAKITNDFIPKFPDKA